MEWRNPKIQTFIGLNVAGAKGRPPENPGQSPQGFGERQSFGRANLNGGKAKKNFSG